MNTPILEHEGKKYLRPITDARGNGDTIHVDVYAVLVAFGVTCPARQHAIKKLLCAGQRSKGDAVADLEGALAAVNRAIELEYVSQGIIDPEFEVKEDKPPTLPPIPPRVYYNRDDKCFYSMDRGDRMGEDFRFWWNHRVNEFPTEPTT